MFRIRYFKMKILNEIENKMRMFLFKQFLLLPNVLKKYKFEYNKIANE